jgi:hypothetical protein
MRRVLVPWVWVASIAFAFASPVAARDASLLKGSVALAKIDVATACVYSDALARCTEPGIFKGPRGRAKASYSWTWTLSGSGVEKGTLTVTYAKAGSLVLATIGTPKKTNPPGSVRTTGSWRVASGTGGFARASGKGRYVFLSLEDRSGNPVTRTGSLTISGTTS